MFGILNYTYHLFCHAQTLKLWENNVVTLLEVVALDLEPETLIAPSCALFLISRLRSLAFRLVNWMSNMA